MHKDSREVRDLERGSPFSQYQYVEVTFNSTANANTEVAHTLKPESYEDVDFQVVGIEQASAPATVPVIYKDSSSTRRPWGNGYIVLRANVASLRATLLLTTRR
jgi:hypothetical protein